MFVLVVSKMGILAQTSNFQNCIKKTNKIPEYARDFKNEYLFIRGINKELDKFTEQYLFDCSELFVSRFSDRIKFIIKKFMKAQELNYLKDTSCFIFKACDVENIVFYLKGCILILKKMMNLLMVILMIIQDIEIFMSCFVNFTIK